MGTLILVIVNQLLEVLEDNRVDKETDRVEERGGWTSTGDNERSKCR